jgi:hypothetical protein
MSNSISNTGAAFGGGPKQPKLKSVIELAMDQTVHKLETFRASYPLAR